MSIINKISKFANKFISLADSIQARPVMSKAEIIVGLEKAYQLIQYDEDNIIQNEQKLHAEKVDPTFPEQAKYQLDDNLKRYLVLSDFLEKDFDRWLKDTIGKLKVISNIPDIDDLEFFRAFKSEMKKLSNIIDSTKSQLSLEGIRLDIAELHSLAMVRRIMAHQLDAFARTPTDPASITKIHTSSES